MKRKWQGGDLGPSNRIPKDQSKLKKVIQGLKDLIMKCQFANFIKTKRRREEEKKSKSIFDKNEKKMKRSSYPPGTTKRSNQI